MDLGSTNKIKRLEIRIRNRKVAVALGRRGFSEPIPKPTLYQRMKLKSSHGLHPHLSRTCNCSIVYNCNAES